MAHCSVWQCSVGRCIFYDLHPAASLSIWEFLSPTGSISENDQSQSSVRKKTKTLDTGIALCWLQCSPCASLWADTSSSSSGSPHRSQGYWGPERSREQSTYPVAASLPSPPSDETATETEETLSITKNKIYNYTKGQTLSFSNLVYFQNMTFWHREKK